MALIHVTDISCHKWSLLYIVIPRVQSILHYALLLISMVGVGDMARKLYMSQYPITQTPSSLWEPGSIV